MKGVRRRRRREEEEERRKEEEESFLMILETKKVLGGKGGTLRPKRSGNDICQSNMRKKYKLYSIIPWICL